MEKRVILFLILSLAIIVGYDYLLKQMGILSPIQTEAPALPSDPAPPSATPDIPPGPPSESRQANVPTTPATAAPESTENMRSRAKSAAAGISQQEQTHVVETDLYRAIFTTRGAVMTSWELKGYKTSGQDPRPIQLMYGGGKFKKPLSIQMTDSTVTAQINEGLYQVQRNFSTLDAAHPEGRMTLAYEAPQNGIRIIKVLTFHHDSYIVDVAVRTEGLGGSYDVILGTNFGIVEWGEGFIGLIGPASIVDGKLEKTTPETEVERKGSVGWVALQDKYFLSVLIPKEAAATVVKKEADKLVSAAVRFPQSAASSYASMQLYAGPKEFDTLKALNVGLEDTIDFGWFIYGSWGIVKAVAKPLFSVLRFIYDYTHNYGIAIILLTVSIKLLFVPLQYKSYKSMKDMQSIQPKVAALQTKYKDDRERLNKELIRLYRDHKVNPVGGCLPMLLQMPVFVALFNILYMTIDLRQAPFILWITDLSVQDPYYVLPIIMGASMVLQQKIMPTTMDPTQAKIMLLLPAFMTVLFLTFPAGLVLYWLTNNMITITQQFVTDRYIFKKPTFTSSPESPPAVTADGSKVDNRKKKENPAGKTEAASPAESP
ncbi:MAG: membrane protein insertase YidC [Nitrospiraceae bacterium]|nr:membrane protein insertase YidC [Nitrospiraceae bacterium]